MTGGPREAADRARAAAGDKDVSVMGAQLPATLIDEGQLAEIQIHLVPVLLGGGVSLFEHLGREVRLERTRVVEAPEGVTHLRYRVLT